MNMFLIGVGGLVGLAGGYAGIGGAPFLVAALVLMGMDQHEAQGTMLAMMLGPMSLPGVYVMRDRARLLLPEIAIGVTAYALCSNLGARAAFALQTGWLQLGFGGLLLGLGAHAILRRKQPGSNELDPNGPTIGPGPLPFTRINVTLISAVIGVVGGLFGIGAGVLMVPLFISLFALHKDDARALSLSILLPPVSLGAIPLYQAHGAIDWQAAAIIFVTYFATNAFGARLGRAHGTTRFLRVMGILLGFLGLLIVGMGLRVL